MATAKSPLPHNAGAPNWDTLAREIHCPLCKYNLRGLVDPRCPECGYRFSWREALAPKTQHPYLFEHYPRHRIWSFCKTALGGLRPIRFWNGITPTHKLHSGEIVTYWIVAYLLGVFLALFALCAEPFIEAMLRGKFPNVFEWGPFVLFHVLSHDGIRFVAVVFLAWPLLTLLILQIFFQSMRRRGVSRAHVRRAVFYSADAILWAVPLANILYGLFYIDAKYLRTHSYIYVHNFVSRSLHMRSSEEISLVCAGCILLAFMICRLCLAYRCYLRFDHPFLVILASQVILFLSAFTILICCGLIR